MFRQVNLDIEVEGFLLEIYGDFIHSLSLKELWQGKVLMGTISKE